MAWHFSRVFLLSSACCNASTPAALIPPVLELLSEPFPPAKASCAADSSPAAWPVSGQASAMPVERLSTVAALMPGPGEMVEMLSINDENAGELPQLRPTSEQPEAWRSPI